eukprot:gb/GECG01013862.1/.p1 GENE.gb/GECG01013862.1/~~gb/GECG01013862.1/.p1  ORF type:complete len:387 (+),score=35.37 gb/GECG01013862.1/:1-1161(+)
MSATISLARNLNHSVREFDEDESLFMYYNDDRTGYIMVLSNPDSCYGVMPFTFYFTLGEGDRPYPQHPPKTEYVSVDGNRIHPNLYVNGQVCLSILGTWRGPGWESHFNLYTLAKHLQLIVNAPYPLQWEPSYTDRTDRTVQDYNLFLHTAVLRRVAKQSYKIPVNNSKAREYFINRLSERLSIEANWNVVTNSFQRLLQIAQTSHSLVSPYRNRLSRAAKPEDVLRLTSFLEELASSPATILSLQIDNIRPSPVASGWNGLLHAGLNTSQAATSASTAANASTPSVPVLSAEVDIPFHTTTSSAPKHFLSSSSQEEHLGQYSHTGMGTTGDEEDLDLLPEYPENEDDEDPVLVPEAECVSPEKLSLPLSTQGATVASYTTDGPAD